MSFIIRAVLEQAVFGLKLNTQYYVETAFRLCTTRCFHRTNKMISLAKLRIHERYNGDLDMWLRTGKRSEKELMDSNDWHLIDTLIQDCLVIQRGLGSPSRNEEAEKRLRESCESEEIIRELEKLAYRT